MRRRQAEETRTRIVTAGAELLHGSPIWNWRALTVRAVAERAGVNERTVYRHFASERELRDAVLGHLEDEAGVDLTGLGLEEVGTVAGRVFDYVSSFPSGPRNPVDPTFAAVTQRQREALLGAVSSVAGDWPDHDRRIAAAVLDVLWSLTSYERLTLEWGLGPGQAVDGLTWAIELVCDAVREERPPARRTH